MKRGHAILYAIIVVLLFAVIYIVNKASSKGFIWMPDYQTHNKQPFGGYALDKMLDASWEYGYEHEYKNVYRMRSENLLTGQNILILANSFTPSETEAHAILDHVAEGHQVLIAASDFGNYEYRLQDSLRFHAKTGPWYNLIGIQLNTDTLQHNCRMKLSSSTFKGKQYTFPEILCVNHFDTVPDNARVIACKNDSLPVAIQYSIGEGNLILCTHPVLFSNYGILSDEHEYVWGLLSSLNGAPLVRTEYYELGYIEDSSSEFRYLLSQPPLRWALYITLGTLLLFILFTAKRKQKPIPVVRKPDNQLMHFVRSMSALYLRKSNNEDILKKKFHFFAEQLSKDYHIDIINQPHNTALFERIAQKTGSDLQDVRTLFKGIDLLDSDFEISDALLMDLVVRMDRIAKT